MDQRDADEPAWHFPVTMCCKLLVDSGELTMPQHRRIHRARPWIAMLALVVACLISLTTGPATAQTVRYFDEPLSPYGYWVEDPYYGRVWRPRETPADWRP